MESEIAQEGVPEVPVEAPAVEVPVEVPVEAPAVEVPVEVPVEAPAPVVEVVVEAPAPAVETPAPVIAAVVEEKVVVPVGPVDIRVNLPNASRKHIATMSETSFTLTESKHQQVVECLQAAFDGESVTTNDTKDTIQIGDEHRLSLLVKDETPYILLVCLDDVEDHTARFDINVALFKLLTQ